MLINFNLTFGLPDVRIVLGINTKQKFDFPLQSQGAKRRKF